MEWDQIGHGQDETNHERWEWLFLTDAADTMIQDRRGLCRLFWKLFLQLCSNWAFPSVIDPNHNVIENVITLSIIALWKVSMICMVKPNDLNLLRKYSRCCAFFTIVSIFSSHLRLLEIVESRHLKCWTISPVLPSTKSRGGRLFLSPKIHNNCCVYMCMYVCMCVCVYVCM